MVTLFFSCLGVFLVYYAIFGMTAVHRGYRSVGNFFGNQSIQKRYGTVKVNFFNWGSLDFSADSGMNMKHSWDRMADGIYAIISAPSEIKLVHSAILFDEIEYDLEKRCVITAKKKGVFIGEPEMKLFLDKFESLFFKDLKASGELDATKKFKLSTSRSRK